MATFAPFHWIISSKSDECDLQMEYILLILYGKGISYYQCETLLEVERSSNSFTFLTLSSNNLTYIVGGIRIWRVSLSCEFLFSRNLEAKTKLFQ